MFVWNHPFEFHFSVSDISDWPKAIFKVWRLDDSNKIDISMHLLVKNSQLRGWTSAETVRVLENCDRNMVSCGGLEIRNRAILSGHLTPSSLSRYHQKR